MHADFGVLAVSGLLNIVFCDDDIAVVDKPSGLLSVRGRGDDKQDSVEARIPQVWPHVTGSMMVHRLDQPTSGLLAVALHAPAHRALRLQFEARSVDKEYEAVVVGVVTGDCGVITLPFRLDVDNRPHQIYDAVHGKIGVTHWRVLSRTATTTRVAFVPTTGRTHQLRTHAAHPLGLGCAIAGDALYGDASTSTRLLLHARTLAFSHPTLGTRMTFDSPVPF
jgi:tRNA pseudouridine32 synthase / 23S rRNA pseudouridine746 synthase